MNYGEERYELTKADERWFRDDHDDDRTCWRCHGQGGWHDCGDDSCCCLDPEDLLSDDYFICPECEGSGEIP